MTSEEQAHLLQSLETALRQGKGPAAAETFREIAGLAMDPVRAGAGVGTVLERLLDDFFISAVQSFSDWLSRHPAEDVAQAALAPIQKQLEAIREWRRVLREIHGERLARDLRAIVRARDIGAATRTAVEILKGAATEPARMQLARQVGAILGSLHNDRPRADQVLAALERHLKPLGMDETHYAAMRESYRQIQVNLSMSELSTQEMQWNRMHTDAVVALIRSLPGRGAVQSPGPEEEKRFYDALHGMLAAYFLDPNALDFDDVSRILQEFCPTDERATGTVEGVEDVAFLRMGAPDRVTSVRALRRLGQKNRLVEVVLQRLEHTEDEKAAEHLIRLAGGLANPRFSAVLLRALARKKSPRLRNALVDALGRVGDEECLDALFDLLKEHASARLIDPPVQRKMERVIAALGRIARHPKTSPEKRNEIVLKTFRVLPDNRQVGRAALQHLCAYDPAGFSTEARRIAVRFLVDDLWSLETRSKLAKGDPGQKTELGFREQPADILINMGPACLPILLETAEKRVLQYSGAYLAMAEILACIGDERALPLIEKMTINALRTDDSGIPEHLRETYFDAAQNQFVPLSRDKIVHALLYAVKKTCGDPGMAFLRDLIRRIRSGEYESPGSETASFLGGLALSEEGTEGMEAVETGGEASFSKRPREEEPLKNLLKDVRGKGFFGVKLEKRIAAIQEVGARLEPEAIEALCEVLGDEERLVRAASETALQAIVSPRLAPEAFRRRVFMTLVNLRKAPRERIQAIQRFFVRLHPDRDPLKAILLNFITTESDESVKKEVAEIFRQAQEERQGPPQPGVGPQPAASPVSNSAEEEKKLPARISPPGAQTLTHQEILAMKREYFAARKAWIAGGKKGAEPKPPEGIGET